MDEKYTCHDLNCGVYVFGSSTLGVCPGCGNEGNRVHPTQRKSFLVWYATAQEFKIDTITKEN